MHTDLTGPIDPVSHGGFRYTICFVDDYSGLILIYLLKNKSDTLKATDKFLADSTPYGNVNRMRMDNGGEFTAN